MGIGEPLAEAAHVAEVLRLVAVVNARVHRVDDGPCAEEETCLEERVSEHVKEARFESSDAYAEKHEAELTHRGVREDLFDVGLNERDRGSEKRGGRTDDGDAHNRER